MQITPFTANDIVIFCLQEILIESLTAMKLRSRVKQSATAIKVAGGNAADTATVEDVDTFDDDVKQKVDSAANDDDDNSAQVEPMDQCDSATTRKSDADIAIARSSKVSSCYNRII